ncbi:CidA/LrgA family protein [Acetobacter sacchari]
MKWSMPEAFLTLLLFQLIGVIAQRALTLPIPGPVIGMFLLAGTLLWRKSRQTLASDDADAAEAPAASPALSSLARSLIACLGLLFVPAGVGLVTELPVLGANVVPIVASLFGSTVLGLLVTAFVMHRATHDAPAPEQVSDADGQVL